MPNHVTTIINLIEASIDEINEFQELFLNDERHIDFDRIIPQPECLKEFSPHSGVLERARMALGMFTAPSDSQSLSTLTNNLALSNACRAMTTAANEEDIPSIIRAISNYQECGFMYWYDWCNENWGTKWGCYEQPENGWEMGKNEYRFDTAWSHPFKMIELMSSKLPGVKFDVRYADEDLGSNCGSYSIKNGEITDENIAPRYNDQTEEQTKLYMKFAFETRYPDTDPRTHGYDENWDYSDDIYEAHS